jgi:hypothetical protein
MTAQTTPPETAQQDSYHISAVRQQLIDQMTALRSAKPGEKLQEELTRSKGVSELAQVIVNSARVEVDYLKATGQRRTPGLEVPPTYTAPSLPAAHNPFPSVTRHRLQDD